MTERKNIFDLKLLTAAKDISLRRVRSYSASLGGGAQIFGTIDDLKRHLTHAPLSDQQNIVLIDPQTPLLTEETIYDLSRFARIFALAPVFHGANPPLVPNNSPLANISYWQLEAFIHCSMTTFLESAIVRTSMGQLCRGARPLLLDRLLRWGHAMQVWEDKSPWSLADAAQHFTRSLRLQGKDRRVVETFSHLLETRLTQFQLRKEFVTFGADGLLTAVLVRCRTRQPFMAKDFVGELRAQGFDIGIVHCHRHNGQEEDGQDIVEIAVVSAPARADGQAAEPLFMVFNSQEKSLEAQVPRRRRATA